MLERAIRAAKVGKTMNGGLTGMSSEKESEYVATIARLRIQVDSLGEVIQTLQTQLSEALCRWPRDNPPALRTILEVASREFGMDDPNEVLTNRRHAAQAVVRQVVCYLAFVLTPHNDTEIALFVKRDRTSVIHGRRKIDRLLPSHPELHARVENIKRELVARKDVAPATPQGARP